MEVTARLNNLRMSPRKVRLAAKLIKGLDVGMAQNQLKFLNKRAAQPILKLLNSAIANAKHNFEIEADNLFVSQILVNEGPALKRWMPRAFGRATPILKRTSHITLVLEEKIPSAKKMKKKKVEEKKEEEKMPVPEIKEESRDIEPEEEKPKSRKEHRPYDASTVSKRKFFSRQGVRRIFQRKSM